MATHEFVDNAPRYSPSFVDALRQRDPDAFTTFYQDHFQMMRTSFRRMLPDRDIEDFMQDFFTKVWEHIEDYQPRPNIPAIKWLITVAGNMVRDKFDKEKTIKRSGERNIGSIYRPASGSLRPSVVNIPDSQYEDEEDEKALYSKPMVAKLHAALDTLTNPQRDIILLEFFEGRYQGRTVEPPNLSPGNRRVTKLRALRALRSALDTK